MLVRTDIPWHSKGKGRKETKVEAGKDTGGKTKKSTSSIAGAGIQKKNKTKQIN